MFIQMNFIKNYLFSLVKNKNEYMVLFGKVMPPKIKQDIDGTPFIYNAHIDLNFISIEDNTLYHIITLNNKEEYNTIVKIAEVLL